MVLLNFYAVGLSPSIQPVQVPVQSLPTFQQIDILIRIGVICEFANSRLNSLIQRNIDIKQE